MVPINVHDPTRVSKSDPAPIEFESITRGEPVEAPRIERLFSVSYDAQQAARHELRGDDADMISHLFTVGEAARNVRK